MSNDTSTAATTTTETQSAVPPVANTDPQPVEGSTVTVSADQTKPAVTAQSKPAIAKRPPVLGSVVTGKVKVIIRDKEFVLVEFDGNTGVLHEKEVIGADQPARMQRRKEFKRGQELQLAVIAVEKDGKPHIRLSEKAIEARAFVQSLVEGSTVEGTVKNRQDYGAFIDLGNGVTGLLHVKQLPGDTNDEHDAFLQTDELSSGKKVTVTVLKVVPSDPKTGKPRIDLSLRQQVQDQRVQSLKSGAVTRGRVLKVDDGAYRIDLGQGLTGLLPLGEVKHQLKATDTVKVKLDRVEGDTIFLTRKGI